MLLATCPGVHQGCIFSHKLFNVIDIKPYYGHVISYSNYAYYIAVTIVIYNLVFMNELAKQQYNVNKS
jgi:hypothetical protein